MSCGTWFSLLLLSYSSSSIAFFGFGRRSAPSDFCGLRDFGRPQFAGLVHEYVVCRRSFGHFSRKVTMMPAPPSLTFFGRMFGFALSRGTLLDKGQVLSLSWLESCNLLYVSCLIRSLCYRNHDRVTTFPGFADSLEDQRRILICWRISVIYGVVSEVLGSSDGPPRVSDAPMFLVVDSEWVCSSFLSVEVETFGTPQSCFRWVSFRDNLLCCFTEGRLVEGVFSLFVRSSK